MRVRVPADPSALRCHSSSATAVISFRLFRLVRQFGGTASPSQPVKPVGIGLHGFLIFGQRFFWSSYFQQHVRQHFARGQFDLAFALGVLKPFFFLTTLLQFQ